MRSEKNSHGNQQHSSGDKQQDGYSWKRVSELEVQVEEISQWVAGKNKIIDKVIENRVEIVVRIMSPPKR